MLGHWPVVQTAGLLCKQKQQSPGRGVVNESHNVIDTPEPALSHRFWNEESRADESVAAGVSPARPD
jgi:hypothetical protein